MLQARSQGWAKAWREEWTWVCRGSEELGDWIREGQRGHCQERTEARGPTMIPGQLSGPVPLPSALCPVRPPDWSPAPLPLPQVTCGSQPGYLRGLYI